MVDRFYFATIGKRGMGLINELYSLFNGVVIGAFEGRSVVVAGNFWTDFLKEDNVPVSTIVDFPHLNDLVRSWGVRVYDSSCTIEVVRATYGTYYELVDVTSEVKNGFIGYQGFSIPKGFDLNLLRGDPCHGRVKSLYVTYAVDGTPHTCVYPERFGEPIRPGAGQFHRGEVSNWVNQVDPKRFYELARNFRFTEKFYDLAQSVLNKLNISGPISVIHVRNESDALKFWSEINKISEDEFEKALTDKYVGLIRKYITPTEALIVLTGRTSSPVIDFLSNEGYNYHLAPKDLVEGRELNAIVDLLLGESCTKTFIGSVNPFNCHGSTFSYLLWQRMKEGVQSVLIDLDDINKPEYLKPEPTET